MYVRGGASCREPWRYGSGYSSYCLMMSDILSVSLLLTVCSDATLSASTISFHGIPSMLACWHALMPSTQLETYTSGE